MFYYKLFMLGEIRAARELERDKDGIFLINVDGSPTIDLYNTMIKKTDRENEAHLYPIMVVWEEEDKEKIS